MGAGLAQLVSCCFVYLLSGMSNPMDFGWSVLLLNGELEWTSELDCLFGFCRQ